MSGRLKLGMVGGGEGAFIGGVHRMAARLDDRWTLVAGAFSSDAKRRVSKDERAPSRAPWRVLRQAQDEGAGTAFSRFRRARGRA